MSELPPKQTPPPEELPQPRLQDEANQGMRDRAVAASEFTHDASTAFVDRVARLALPAQEWAKDSGESMVGHAVDAGRIAAGGIRRAFTSTRETASDSWAGIKNTVVNKRAKARHTKKAERHSQGEEKAATTMERMDHKNALYEHLGLIAAGHDSDVTPGNRWSRGSTERRPQTRTVVERHMDRRLHKKAFKRAYKQAEQKFVNKAYGGEAPANSLGVLSRTADLVRKARIGIDHHNGTIDAHERARRRLEVATNPTHSSSPEQRKARDQLFREQRYASKVAEQPSRAWNNYEKRTPAQETRTHKWRNRRQQNAIGKIIENHKGTGAHRVKAAEAEAKIDLHNKEMAKRKADRGAIRHWDEAHLEDRDRFPDADISKVWNEAHREDVKFDADLAREKAEAKAARPRRTVKKLERKPTPPKEATAPEVNPQFRWVGNRAVRVNPNTSNN